MTTPNPRIASPADVARLLQPVVVGGDILAYSYVRELHRAFDIERTIVLATQDIKMLSPAASPTTGWSRTSTSPKGCTRRSSAWPPRSARRARNARCSCWAATDCHARMLSAGKARLEAAGYAVPYIDFPLLDDITQKRRFYDLCDELGHPLPAHVVLQLRRGRPPSCPQATSPTPSSPSRRTPRSSKTRRTPSRAGAKIYEIEGPRGAGESMAQHP